MKGFSMCVTGSGTVRGFQHSHVKTMCWVNVGLWPPVSPFIQFTFMFTWFAWINMFDSQTCVNCLQILNKVQILQNSREYWWVPLLFTFEDWICEVKWWLINRGLTACVTVSHLHAADINRQHCGEEKHLQEEVGHQPDNSKQTELLRDRNQWKDQSSKQAEHMAAILNKHNLWHHS